MKVYLVYEGEPAEDVAILGERHGRESLKLKLTMPAAWQEGPCRRLVTYFVDTFNKKFVSTPLNAEHLGLRVGAKSIDHIDDAVGAHIREYNDVIITHRVAPKAVATAPEGTAVCTNFGCGQRFVEADNHDGACHHHARPPVFHDTAKYWACCPDHKALDWGEFEAIPPCTVGRHDTAAPAVSFKSEPVASVPLSEAQVRAMEGVAAAAAGGGDATATRRCGPREFEGALPTQPQEVIDGKATCRNFGCQKTFAVAENHPAACTYHRGGPVFHDTAKYWACCPDRKALDFDDFAAVPGCTTGSHKL